MADSIVADFDGGLRGLVDVYFTLHVFYSVRWIST